LECRDTEKNMDNEDELSFTTENAKQRLNEIR